MKILYLTDQLYLHGGIEKVLSQKANYLAEELGYEVTVLTTEQQGRATVYPFSKKIDFVDLGIDYQRDQSYFSAVNLRKIPVHYRRLKKEIRKIRPDIIVSVSFGPDYYFLRKTAGNIPVIKEYHSSRALRTKSEKGLLKKMLRKLEDRSERNFDRIVVLNEDERPFYNSDRISVISNPAEFSDYKSKLNSKVVLAAGRLSPVKNFEELIDIWQKVAADFPDWQLHFYGEDYLGTQSLLEMKVKKYGLQDSVKLMGPTSDMKTVMQQSSIYAMTSETECFPMVLLEALSAGVPVISYDCPTGPKHIVTDGEDGFLVEHKNQDDFEVKVRELMSDPALRIRIGSNATENISRFNIDKIMNSWNELFLSLKLND